jgi:hypothetical protein
MPADFQELSERQLVRHKQAVLKPGTNVECHGFPIVLKKNL